MSGIPKLKLLNIPSEAFFFLCECQACDGSAVHERLGEKADDFGGSMCDATKCVFVGDGQHDKEQGEQYSKMG